MDNAEHAGNTLLQNWKFNAYCVYRHASTAQINDTNLQHGLVVDGIGVGRQCLRHDRIGRFATTRSQRKQYVAAAGRRILCAAQFAVSSLAPAR